MAIQALAQVESIRSASKILRVVRASWIDCASFVVCRVGLKPLRGRIVNRNPVRRPQYHKMKQKGASCRSRLPHQVTLHVKLVPKTTIFIMQAIGPDPEYTQAFLQAAMEEYIVIKKEFREQSSDMTVAGLAEETMRLEREVRKCDGEVAAFQSTNGLEVI
jgi:hypothetical protein